MIIIMLIQSYPRVLYSSFISRFFLRRLSSKKDDEVNNHMKLTGTDNRGFELDPPPPNSPWRFPYNRPAAQGIKFNRSISQDSMTSQTSNLAVTFSNRDKIRLSILKKSTPAIRYNLMLYYNTLWSPKILLLYYYFLLKYNIFIIVIILDQRPDKLQWSTELRK